MFIWADDDDDDVGLKNFKFNIKETSIVIQGRQTPVCKVNWKKYLDTFSSELV